MANRSLTKMGLLRILGFLEGLSLLILIFVAVPMKYYYGNPNLSATLGPIHGAIFVLFIFMALLVGIKHNWKIKLYILIFLACFIPFGTFYIDNKFFAKLKSDQSSPQ